MKFQAERDVFNNFSLVLFNWIQFYEHAEVRRLGACRKTFHFSDFLAARREKRSEKKFSMNFHTHFVL
jgi:hypothetical protein